MQRNWWVSVQYIPYIVALGAIALFVVGYISHMMIGANNTVEQISEDLLNREYNIKVEFSNEAKQ